MTPLQKKITNIHYVLLRKLAKFIFSASGGVSQTTKSVYSPLKVTRLNIP